MTTIVVIKVDQIFPSNYVTKVQFICLQNWKEMVQFDFFVVVFTGTVFVENTSQETCHPKKHIFFGGYGFSIFGVTNHLQISIN